MPEGIRTPDPRLRRPLLYPAELRTHFMDSCYPKRVMGIEPTYLAWKASVLPLNYTRTVFMNHIQIGVTGFEPAASWSQTRRSSQAEPHPVSYARRLDTCCIIHMCPTNVNRFFTFFLKSLQCTFSAIYKLQISHLASFPFSSSSKI